MLPDMNDEREDKTVYWMNNEREDITVYWMNNEREDITVYWMLKLAVKRGKNVMCAECNVCRM